ncbi:MAG: hypothetical protein Q7S45_04825 [Candidatus Curtissbacteria bacterium]|nr:hypothetical protein [Candidatus Curtissbacteria bacterium]
MRKILWAVFTILLAGLIFFGLTKISKNFSFKKSAAVQSVNVEPVVQIEGTDLYLAENGEVVARSGSKKPLLYLDKNIKFAAGQKITQGQILFAAKIAAGLIKSDFTVATIRLLDSRDIAVYNPQDAIAVFSSNKDANLQIDSLQQVLAKAKIDATKIVKIDLRFDKPVIAFK